MNVVDLFCGAGGTSTGILAAGVDLRREVSLVAVNHWQTAINTHSLNHPGVRHICGRLENIKPLEAVPGGRLNLLAASPECTHHSIAAGGRPKNDQSRAQAWLVCDWLSALNVGAVLLENVREWEHWGPLDSRGHPLKSKRGQYFRAFLQTVENMGYRVDYRIQNAADFGDPTSRRRLLVMASKKRFEWPKNSHAPAGPAANQGQRDFISDSLRPYRTAREIIDWSLKGQSIFRRKKPLSPNTLRRIAAGLKKFGGAAAEPFLVILNGTAEGQFARTAQSVDAPLPTQTTANHIGVAEPFIISAGGPDCPAVPVSKPLGTVMTRDHRAVVEPVIITVDQPLTNRSKARSLDEPVPTVTGSKRIGIAQPFITHVTHQGKRRQHGVDEPVPTVTGAHNGELALVEPFILGVTHTQNPDASRSIDRPLQTITTAKGGELAVVEPIILGQQSGHNGSPVDAPCPTVATSGAIGLVEPFIVKYYGTATAQGIGEPLHTIATKDRFMLVETRTGRAVAELDILFRMLQPHELAAAMSFPKGYQFTGNRGEQVKQIGNAVPVELARAHARALLS